MRCDWCGRVYKAKKDNLTCPYCGGQNDKNEQKNNNSKTVNNYIERKEKQLEDKAEGRYANFSNYLANNKEFEKKIIRFLNIAVIAIGVILSILMVHSWIWVYFKLK